MYEMQQASNVNAFENGIERASKTVDFSATQICCKKFFSCITKLMWLGDEMCGQKTIEILRIKQTGRRFV